jgi:hypothetical protein
VQGITDRNFGLVVAYLIPGFLSLWGLGFIDHRVEAWLAGPVDSGPTVGGVLYVTIASLGLGMLMSAVRWAIIDQLHHATGLRRPTKPDLQFTERLSAYTWLDENFYRYYQFYGNTLIALLVAFALWRVSLPGPVEGALELDIVVAVLCVILFAGSRSALSRYYGRIAVLVDNLERKPDMTNGSGRHPAKPKPASASKTTEVNPKAPAPSPKGQPRKTDK